MASGSGGSPFSLIRNLHHDFLSGYTSDISQQCVRVPLFPYSHQYLLFGGFALAWFYLVTITEVRDNLRADLMCISLVAKDVVEHVLLYLLTIAFFFLRTVFSLLPHLLIGWFILGVYFADTYIF